MSSKAEGGSASDHNPTLVEVADATSAAPTYFPTIKGRNVPSSWLVGGGLSANNPAMCALAEALKTHKSENIKLLSIGTGVQTRGRDEAEKDGKASRDWGGIEWLTHGLIDHLFAGNVTATDYHCRQILGNNYLRIDGELIDCDDDLDNVSAGNITCLKGMGERWFGAFGERVKGLLGVIGFWRKRLVS